MYDLTLSGRCRCLLVWLLATAAAGLAVVWAAPDLDQAVAAVRAGDVAGHRFDQMVVWLAAAALTVCATWAWIVTGIVVVQALAGRPRASAPWVPGWLLEAILVACGLAVVSAGSAAHAHDPQGDDIAPVDREVLAGLPPPERVLGALRPPPPPPAAPDRVHVVRVGDTLWDIAVADLEDRADDARITAHWHRIYRLNRAVIGADPHLIDPGQELRLPTPPNSPTSPTE
jgi:LysM domain-containing protein